MESKLTWGLSLLGIKLFINPSLDLVYMMFIFMALDFVTGIVKAKMNQKQRTSEGYRRTITKLLQYLIPVGILWVGVLKVPEYSETLRNVSGWVIMFICYIEVTSIFENLYAIDRSSVISKFLYKPVLKILTFGLENNAAVKAADNLKKEEE